MFRFSRDFVRQDGVRMVLGGQEGIPASCLNPVQSRMLSSLEIPHHLRLYLKEMDLNVTLEYPVSGKKLLSHLLKGAKMTLTECFGLLLQIAQGIEDGRRHMLAPQQYALHEDYIFIEGSLQRGRVFLTYIPLLPEASQQPLGESLKRLIMAFMPGVTELRGDSLQRLLQYCGEDHFTVSGWKELLSALLTEDDGCTEPAARESDPVIAVPGDTYRAERFFQEKNTESKGSPPPAGIGTGISAPRISETATGEGMVGGRMLQVNEWLKPWADTKGTSRKQEYLSLESEEEAGEPEDQSSSAKTYVVLGCILTGALLWKYLYMDHPSGISLMICGIVSIVLLAVSMLAITRKLSLPGWIDPNLKSSGEDDPAEAGGFGGPGGFGAGLAPGVPAGGPAVSRIGAVSRGGWFGEPNPSRSISSQPAERKGSRPDAWKPVRAAVIENDVQERQAAKGNSMHATVLLSQEQETNPADGKSLRAGLPYLERTDEGGGQSETIDLNRTSFIIGRSPEVAQYVEKSEGASRVHAEIFRSGSGYILKDLDSRNGTKFQGEPMIPYKEYPLQEGDRFTIVKGHYTFHQR